MTAIGARHRSCSRKVKLDVEPLEKVHIATYVRSTTRKRYPYQCLKQGNSGRSMFEWQPMEKVAHLELAEIDSGYEEDIDE